ncbi:hypothetical protein MUK42_37254 [Musa troglodytarum]|uniref:Uncharacterized protein n=1 Tax=Musa troglodytarum TaxID=320322 RepID=A0A9E7K7L6_9LILI|nr:hypothetical protein MUK42_37254 [Musa troglodytarum]
MGRVNGLFGSKGFQERTVRPNSNMGVDPIRLVNHVAFRTLRYGSDLFCLPSHPIPPPLVPPPVSDLGFPVAASDAYPVSLSYLVYHEARFEWSSIGSLDALEHRRRSQRGPLRTPVLFSYRPMDAIRMVKPVKGMTTVFFGLIGRRHCRLRFSR